MNPKEKAKELYLKMLKWQDESSMYIERNVISSTSKQCALIAVDEILDFLIGSTTVIDYWKEVKQEINNL